MRITTSCAFLTGFFVALLLWWLVGALFDVRDTPFNNGFAFAYGVMPIMGGILGYLEARKWGLTKSALGKALLFLSAGLITWGIGETIYSYYNFFLGVEVPYPSWADASFILSWPLWSMGVFFLSQATGAKFGLKSLTGQLQLVLIPIIAIAISYYLLIIVARGGTLDLSLDGGLLKVFFDLAYPIWDVVIITMALVIYGLSFRYLGGFFKWPVLITLLGFAINYLADFGFSYTTTVGTHYNGSWVDLLFTASMFTLSFGINSFNLKEV